jgi:hypothetical protein
VRHLGVIIVGVLVLGSLIVDGEDASFSWSSIGRVAKLPLPCHCACHSHRGANWVLLASITRKNVPRVNVVPWTRQALATALLLGPCTIPGRCGLAAGRKDDPSWRCFLSPTS